MKKVLTGSSALVAASLLSSTAFAAGPELSMSGYYEMEYGVQGSDVSTANTDGVDGDGLQTDGFIVFDASATADNGLEYGVVVDMEAHQGSFSIDESYIDLSGGWGRMHIGADDSVVPNNVPGGESALAGAYLYDAGYAPASTGSASSFATLTSDTADRAKFSYYSPSFSGFSVGLSYAPNSNSDGIANSTASNATATDSGQVGGTLAYSGNFSGVGINAGVGYETADVDGSANREGLMAGGTVSFAGFTLGAGYGDNEDTGCRDGATDCSGGGWWNLGASYGFGPATVYAGYMDSEVDVANDGVGDDTYEEVGLGVAYTVAEGMSAYAEYSNAESTDTSAGTNMDTDLFILGTSVGF